MYGEKENGSEWARERKWEIMRLKESCMEKKKRRKWWVREKEKLIKNKAIKDFK